MRTISNVQLLGVADDVLSTAARNGLRAGSRLPTERALAHELQLSRSTIRNALALLEQEALVSREVGRGTFLRGDPNARMHNRVEFTTHSSIAITVSPTDVMTARKLIEPAAMASIVENATLNDFNEIERCLLGADGVSEYDEFEQWDLALHRALIHASHNSLMESMYQLVEEARQGETWGNLKRRSDSLERREGYRNQHRAIFEALRNRDGREAREAMQRHLRSVEENLQSSAQN